tara:strand:+ start:1227 stop:1667 length:441 start_codon:yes stop_codon:yes gene_type:complete
MKILLQLVIMLFVTSYSYAGDCPQFRNTKKAPAMFLELDRTKTADKDNGRVLFHKSAKPIACKMCHGEKGDGNGKLGKALMPRPRNFTCESTMRDISPGQMFYIIQNGSKGTGMQPQRLLEPKEIWDLVKYIREELAVKSIEDLVS